MPHHKSTKKRVILSWKQNRYNLAYKTKMKSMIKKVRSITDKDLIQEELKNAYSLLDKLVSKGIIHKNKAANQKSKLAKYAGSLN
ncbi:30S ribosomal protein S20 [candidate division KSB1 bacterium 4572_119]|nr:MAG: 30S ribosomal protein S20 [candidate division KSB1 bacterium 4572_119]